MSATTEEVRNVIGKTVVMLLSGLLLSSLGIGFGILRGFEFRSMLYGIAVGWLVGAILELAEGQPKPDRDA